MSSVNYLFKFITYLAQNIDKNLVNSSVSDIFDGCRLLNKNIGKRWVLPL